MSPGFASDPPLYILQLSQRMLQAAFTLKVWATTAVDFKSLCRTTASPC